MQAIALFYMFFIPGFLIMNILFPKVQVYEKILLSILFSIGFFIVIGLILGFNETMNNLTGGLTSFNLWIYSTVLNLILLFISYRKGFHKYLNKIL